MKKLILKFWVFNLLSIIVLFIMYRIVFLQAVPSAQNWFEKILYFLYIFLNIGFSLIYAAVMLVASLMIFLNFNAKIRGNYFLSLLAFLGIPLAGVLYFISSFILDIQNYNSVSECVASFISVMYTVAAFPFIYLFYISIEFLLFRLLIKKHEVSENRKIIL